MLIKTVKYSLLAATIASLAACGGSQERGLHWDDEPTPQPPVVVTIDGTVGTFALDKAKVDFTEAGCTDLVTNNKGKFSFSTSAGCKVSGITIPESADTKDYAGNPFTGILKLKSYDFSKATAPLFITPLTTLDAYAGTNPLNTVFTRLGLSASVPSTKVEEYDANTKASKDDQAIILSTQFLATFLEDQQQALQNKNQTDAAKTAYEAIIAKLVAGSGTLFSKNADGTGKVDATLIGQIVAAVFPTAVDPAGLASQIHLSTQKYYSDLLATPGSIIDTPVAVPEAPEYAPPTIGQYSLAQLQSSTPANPLTLNLTDLKSGNVELGVGLKNVLASNLKDTIKFTVQIDTSTPNPAGGAAITRTATMILDSLNVTLTAPDATGFSKIDTATIPVNAKLSVDTASTQGTQTNQTLRNIPVNNGSITLDGILSVSGSAKQQYTNYINSFPAGTAVKTTTTIVPVTYSLDSTTSTNVAHFVLQ